jgi:hypothetical protein
MKTIKRAIIAAGIAAALVAIPQAAGAYWWGPGPVAGYWGHSYVYDPAYQWGSPAMRGYIRDLYRYGPGYASYRQQRRYGWWW